MGGSSLPSPRAARVQAIVTGGAGFLGSHLCRRLLERGFHVLALDDLSTGDVRNLADLSAHPRFHFRRHDVSQPYRAPAAMIFNLACCASPVHYQADPEHTLRTCVEGVLNALHLAREEGAVVLQASTSEIYGEPEVHPQVESYRGAVSTTGPRACYDEGKRCAETLCFDAQRKWGARIRVARIFNTYGPRMDTGDGRVVSNLIVQALRGEPMTIHGDGRQTRSFCYVDDMIEALLRLMNAADDACGPMNLGNPAEVTVRELALRIRELTGTASKLVYRPMPVDDPTRRCPDISRARSRLGWEPRVPLDEGLRRTIAWFESVLARGRAAQQADAQEKLHVVA